MRIIVTGSQGFIGSYLIRDLIDAGYEIVGFDLAEGSLGEPKYRLLTGDILDKDRLKEAMGGVECIVHLAAAHRDDGISNQEYFRINELGTRNVLDCAAERGVDKLIFFSSAAIYGRPGKADEGTTPHPSNSYGASKLQAEKEVRKWVDTNASRSAIIIRPTAIFGPENYANMYRLISRVCSGRFTWIGHGENIKSIAYIENLVAATLFLMDKLKPGIQVFNYSDEPQLSMRQLVNLVSEKAHVTIRSFGIPVPLALLAGSVLHLTSTLSGKPFDVNVRRIRKFCMHSEYPAERIRELGFQQPFSIEEGIEKTIRWCRESGGGK